MDEAFIIWLTGMEVKLTFVFSVSVMFMSLYAVGL